MRLTASLFFFILTCVSSSSSPNGLARTPPMGFMSWQTFRCATDCALAPTACISEALYQAQADALVSGGFAAAGYTGIHLDDCIMDLSGRDPITNELRADPVRFPSGFPALANYIHARNLTFAMYTAESTTTCGGYPASKGFESLDAKTFAGFGADYIKADGCGDPTYYPTGYQSMGSALQASGRDIVYSCSWPAYLGDDETQKPFAAMIADGCNLWRNFIDQGPVTGYVQGILEHFGNYSEYLSQWVAPGHYHDPDVLLVGSDAISDDMARSQLALYCILAAPLILGTDMRNMKPSQTALLLNLDVIAVNQDPAVRAGVRLGGASAENAPTQVWYRPLENGDVAVALYNAGPPSTHPWHTACASDYMNITQGGYFAPTSPQPTSWCFAPGAFSQSLLDWYCCNSDDCAGYNFSAVTGAGCLFKDTEGAFIEAVNVTGYQKKGFQTPTGSTESITVNFASIGFFPGVPLQVYDLWERKVVAVTNATNYTASVPWQGTSFFRLSQPPSPPPLA